MDRSVLYLGQPLIYTYNDYAFISAILAGRDEVMPWYYNNFINISYAESWDTYFFDNGELVFEHCPFLHLNIVSYDLILSAFAGNLKDFIVQAIDSGYYFRLFADRYYIPHTPEYRRHHMKHRLCVYGYDLPRNTVYFADNIDDYRFGCATCSFDELYSGFHSGALSISSDEEWHYKIMLYKLRECPEVSVDPQWIKAQIENYLDSRYSCDVIYNNRLVMGRQSVERLLDRMRDSRLCELDTRAFHLFYERSQLMLMRLEYMAGNGLDIGNEVLCEYAALRDSSAKLRNLALKFNMTQKRSTLGRIEQRIMNDLRQEERLYRKILLPLSRWTGF